MRKYPQLLYIFLIILASPIALSDTWEDMKKCQNQCSLYCQGIFIKGKGKIDKYLTQCGVTTPPLEIEYYRSDYCNGAPEGVFYSTSRCDKLFFNYSIYAIKVNGKCIDILDANIRDTCKRFKNGFDGVKLYNHAYCNERLIAVVTPNTNCSEVSGSVYGVKKKGGECQSVGGTSASRLCYHFGGK